MLVLTRRLGERVVLIAPTGERILIKVLKRQAHVAQVQVCFEAPPEYGIYREEIAPAEGVSKVG